MGERRIRTSIKTEFRAGRVQGRGKIRNLGANGMFVGCDTLPEQGDLVDLSFPLPSGEQLALQGLVWWTTRDSGRRHRTSGFGLRLMDSDPRYAATFAALSR